MKQKNLEFFAIKLLILLIIEVVLMLLCFVIGTVLRTVGVEALLGEGKALALQRGAVFLLFLGYSMYRAYRFRVNGPQDRAELGRFALREGAVYAVFTLPLFIWSLVAGAALPAWLTFFYAPQMLMYTVSRSAVVGFGVPVLVYTAAVTAMRLAALVRAAVTPGETRS